MRFWLIAAGIVVAVLIVTGLASVYLFGLARDACVSMGYREPLVLSDGTVYCATRINGTDVVVPLSKTRPIKVAIP